MKTRFLIKQSGYWRPKFLKFRIGIYFVGLFTVFVFSIATGLSNIYYFLLDIPKLVIFFSITVATAYFVVLDKEQYEKWHERSFRKINLQGKLLLTIIEGLIFFLVSLILLGIIYFSGFPTYYETKNFSELESNPLRFVPSTLEGILFAIIISLQIIALFTSINWYYARCWKIIGFNEQKKVIKIASYRMIVSFFITVLIWCLSSIFLDHAYFNFIYPDVYPNFHFLDNSIFSSQPSLYLYVQLGFLVLINLFYLIDGILANKLRTDFIEVDLLESTS
ncbi:MAG: hypothetical protein ACFFDW_00785 [Candidatus Thorarchaeota archaeon]